MTRRVPHRIAVAGLLALLLATPACTTDEAAVDTTADVAGFAGDVGGLDLEDYKGRVVVLNFWATWCGPCRIEIPALVRLRNDFKDDVAIIGISLDQGPLERIQPLIDEFVTRYEINYPIYVDAEQKVAAGYAGNTPYMQYVPTTVVIDQRGRVVQTHQGVPRKRGGGFDPYGVLAAEIQTLLDDA